LDGPTGFLHAAQRRRSSHSRAPDAVMAFAASTGFRRPPTAHLSAVPDRDPFADVSDNPIKAYQAYKAAIEDPHCSRADLARLTGTLKLERQSDRERARYYRMQEEEAAVLAAAAAGAYDSDD